MHTTIMELNDSELADVAGGFWPIVVGIAAGLAANYIYDSVGGKEGIDAAVSAALTPATDIEVAAVQALANTL